MKQENRQPHFEALLPLCLFSSPPLLRCHIIAHEASALGQTPTSSCPDLPFFDPLPTQMEPSRHVRWTKLFFLPPNKHTSDSLDFLPYNFKCFGALELTDVTWVCPYRQVPFVQWPCPQPSTWNLWLHVGSTLPSFPFFLESRG